MISLPKTIVLMFALAFVGCASAELGEVSSHTSDPVAVAAMADNAQLLGQVMPSLIITLEIIDDSLSLVDARVAMVPRTNARRQEGELINIIGMSNDERVSTVAIPDQRVNIEEGKGLVRLDQRTLIAALPLPQKIDTFEVQLPGVEQPYRFDVREQIDSFCKEYPESEPCLETVENERD